MRSNLKPKDLERKFYIHERYWSESVSVSAKWVPPFLDRIHFTTNKKYDKLSVSTYSRYMWTRIRTENYEYEEITNKSITNAIKTNIKKVPVNVSQSLTVNGTILYKGLSITPVYNYELRRFREDAQAAVNVRQNQVFQEINEKLQTIIQEYAQSNSYSAIFLRDQNQIYVSQALDVTEKIIEIYNQRYSQASAEVTPPAGN